MFLSCLLTNTLPVHRNEPYLSLVCLVTNAVKLIVVCFIFEESFFFFHLAVFQQLFHV